LGAGEQMDMDLVGAVGVEAGERCVPERGEPSGTDGAAGAAGNLDQQIDGSGQRRAMAQRIDGGDIAPATGAEPVAEAFTDVGVGEGGGEMRLGGSGLQEQNKHIPGSGTQGKSSAGRAGSWSTAFGMAAGKARGAAFLEHHRRLAAARALGGAGS